MTIYREKQKPPSLRPINDFCQRFWKIILRKYALATWEDIEEVEPDEIDLQILEAIEKDPECQEFTKESDIDWNS